MPGFGFGFGFGNNLHTQGAEVNVFPSILSDGNTVAWYDRTNPNGVVKDANGVESIYWDMTVGNTLRSEELSSGTTTPYAVYEITATEDNYFYTGCKVGDIFPCGVVKTCTATNKVKRVLGNHATQPVVTRRPINGVFDGVDDFMKTAPFTYAQPENIYLLFKQLSWTVLDFILDGEASGSGLLKQGGYAPGLVVNAGTDSAYVNSMDIGSMGIATILFNGANSTFQINDTAELSGNYGANNMGGICIGRVGAADIRCANIYFEQGVFRNIADTADSKTIIKNYLKKNQNLSAQRFDNGKLVITWDDALDNHTDVVYPILSANNVKSTFYLTTDNVTDWNKWKTMHSNGMDLQCHTKSHPYLTDPKITHEAYIAELTGVNNAFIANSLPAPQHTSYTWGQHDDDIKTWAAEMRLTARSVIAGDVVKNSDKYILRIESIDNIGDTKVAALKTKLSSIQSDKKAYILLAHGVDTVDGISRISEAHLLEIINHAKAIGMDIITVSELYQLMIT